ncbi:CvpA family protein [Parachitinimonas caeni]|uniref:CvpA family protein n=1 Tax=Parachitinimonas caeni TaxID=3031301 RepID=A0ABT7E5K3_9NEIS|nr:CvpA family protein [Parachitinimonas caeni]MDK2126192.1 CvpA family protein [Parachitinimonas caeni]
MTVFDYLVLSILGISVLISVLKGGVSEIISLAAWVLAFWLARTFTADVAAQLPPDIPTAELRLLAAFLAIFLGVWFISAIIRITISQLIKAADLAAIDRVIGAMFGVLRGLLLITVLVLLAGLTPLPKNPVWRNAMFSAPFEAVAQSLIPWLPDALAKRIHYD